MNDIAHHDGPTRRVGLVGYGAIGATVGRALVGGAIPSLVLTGVHTRGGAAEELAVPDPETLVESSDLVVEAAGPTVLHTLAPLALERGRTLVVVSTGAFLAPQLWPLLAPRANGGRLVLSTGAVAGLDIVKAARLAGSEVRIALRTTKKPHTLVQSWMSERQRAALAAHRPGEPPLTVFTGAAAEAAQRFPANLNVAATLAIGAGSPDAVTVQLVADAGIPRTRHEVTISSALGEHRLVLDNQPSSSNPATSGIVPWAVLRCLAELAPAPAATFL